MTDSPAPRDRIAAIIEARHLLMSDAQRDGLADALIAAFPVLAAEPTTDAEQVAQRFHETYERLAPSFDYSTRVESAVPWSDVPENNKRLMIAVASEVLAALAPEPAEPDEYGVNSAGEPTWTGFIPAVSPDEPERKWLWRDSQGRLRDGDGIAEDALEADATHNTISRDELIEAAVKARWEIVMPDKWKWGDQDEEVRRGWILADPTVTTTFVIDAVLALLVPTSKPGGDS